MNQLAVNNVSLLFAVLLVVVAVVISAKEKLGLTRDIIYAVARTVIQLVVVGYILKYVFQLDHAVFTLAMCLFIIFNASRQAHKRNPHTNKQFMHSFVAIFTSTVITLAILIFSGSLAFIPSQVIPITGMIASNSMVAIGLCYKHMHTQFHDQRQQVLEKLALGADMKSAASPILTGSIRTGMQPTIDSAKTVGLVSLPGMMSGLIFAGVDPVHAIKYQIMVMFMLLSATSLGAFIAGYLSYKNYFNARLQLTI